MSWIGITCISSGDLRKQWCFRQGACLILGSRAKVIIGKSKTNLILQSQCYHMLCYVQICNTLITPGIWNFNAIKKCFIHFAVTLLQFNQFNIHGHNCSVDYVNATHLHKVLTHISPVCLESIKIIINMYVNKLLWFQSHMNGFLSLVILICKQGCYWLRRKLSRIDLR